MRLCYKSRGNVDFALRFLNKALNYLARLRTIADLSQKKQACVLGEGAVLHPLSRFENGQQDPSAIVIGAHSYIIGHIQVLGHGGNVRIGEFCFLGECSRIWSADSITIGNRVLISHNVNIHDNNSHSLSAQVRHYHVNQIISKGHPKQVEDVLSAPIVIEDDAWIGFNAIILKGVRIGKGAVVGAGAVVTKNVPDYAIVVGNPAAVVGQART